ncbi:signal-transducing adaptor protein 2 isoform X2 [Ascaphus truei]|uniref:signal-transducing adaptor protein 2 isoform X2 n=1 Tax=Ascaphus truei TaxID=8439 RepID=UPI003F5A7BF9
MANPVTRTKVPVPEHYYEEYLYKKDLTDKVYKKLWVGLQGNTLCFYSNHKDLRRVDCLSLDDYVSLTESAVSIGANGLHHYPFSLRLKGREVQLKTESVDSRGMWCAFILTIAELKIPASVTLLPGPLLSLKEALQKEKERRAREEMERSTQDENPSCFYDVSRIEAESLLKENPAFGSLLLRPGGDKESLSLTTCQKIHSQFVLKHYRITLEQEGYVIQVEPRVTCSSMAKVVDHFVKISLNRLSPFEKRNEYENKIGVIEVNNENGEVIEEYPREKTGATKSRPFSKVPPPIPMQPPPQDEEYENPKEQTTWRRSSKEAIKSPPFSKVPPPIPMESPPQDEEYENPEEQTTWRRSSKGAIKTPPGCKVSPRIPIEPDVEYENPDQQTTWRRSSEGATKNPLNRKVFPHLPLPPEDEYETPDQQTTWSRPSEANLNPRRQAREPPNQAAPKPKEAARVRMAAPAVQSSGLNEELRRKLEQRRAQIE